MRRQSCMGAADAWNQPASRTSLRESYRACSLQRTLTVSVLELGVGKRVDVGVMLQPCIGEMLSRWRWFTLARLSSMSKLDAWIELG
eukprot:307497-Pleurochrysis_carterae.AAC.3